MSSANLVARLRASPWTSIFIRIVSVAAALGVLAWVGRAATANANAPVAVPLATDAGLASPVPPPLLAPPPAPPVVASPPGLHRGRASPDDPVFLNHADEAELRRLPGVGAKRAEAILTLRGRVGRFHRVEDLMRVKGIGRAAIKKWRPLVRLDAPPAQPADAGVP